MFFFCIATTISVIITVTIVTITVIYYISRNFNKFIQRREGRRGMRVNGYSFFQYFLSQFSQTWLLTAKFDF